MRYCIVQKKPGEEGAGNAMVSKHNKQHRDEFNDTTDDSENLENASFYFEYEEEKRKKHGREK